MIFRRAAVVCQNEEKYEIAVYIHIVYYLLSRVRVMYAGRLGKLLVAVMDVFS